jgi:hypothetical protein
VVNRINVHLHHRYRRKVGNWQQQANQNKKDKTDITYILNMLQQIVTISHQSTNKKINYL